MFDNNYFSSYYYPGYSESQSYYDRLINKYDDRMFLNRPLFTIQFRPRPGCFVHDNN